MYKFSFCLTPDILFFKIKKFNWKCISLDKISLHEEVKVLFEYIVLFYAQYAIQFSKASEVETNTYFSKKWQHLRDSNVLDNTRIKII